MLTRRQFAAGAAAASGLFAGPLFAQQKYPTQPIRSICMFPPGSGADILVRFYAAKLAKLAGQNVIVENRAGAFGNIATEAVYRAKPDGYTIYIAPGSSVLAAAPHLFKKINYDPLNGFEHVTTLGKLAFILCVSGKSPFRSVPELTEHLKKEGEKANYGSIANTGLVGSELYKAAFGLQTTEVKYKDPSALANDLLNGQLTFLHIDPITFAGQIKDGRMRALAVTSAERIKAMPDIMGAREAGIPNSDLTAWWSVHTPRGTPKPVLDNLEKWFNQISADPETAAFLSKAGTDVFPGNQASTRALLEIDLKKWGEYVKLAKIPPI
ncbi:MAG: tripartite tricarboxylate transporter substrate binding protein [Alphaproteobacteria bacterium]|nr:tripartite tricarboxylate transporter substrate binding protein [Alphaproteobacteria bacterium]